MDKEFIPVLISIVGLIGAVAGFVIGFGLNVLKDWIQIERQLKADERKQGKAKLEDLHLALSELNAIVIDFVSEVTVLKSLELSKGEAFGIILKQNRHLNHQMAKIVSLQQLYAPELDDVMDQIGDHALPIVKHWSDYVNGRMRAEEYDAFSNPLIDEIDKLSEAVAEKLKMERTASLVLKRF